MSKTLLNFVANNYFKYMLCKKFLAMAFAVASFVLVVPNVSLASFACTTGTLSDICYVSNSQTLTNGEVISGSGSLVIQNGGILTSAAENKFGIEMGGDITV
ncbi:MAG: hypothetical protein WCO84_05350, partial [bacterium]